MKSAILLREIKQDLNSYDHHSISSFKTVTTGNKSLKATCPFICPTGGPGGPRATYLAAAVSPALHQGRGGAQLDGLGLMEDDGWQGLLFQC